MPGRAFQAQQGGDKPQAPAEPGNAASAGHHPLTWKLLLRRAVVVAVTGLVIYLLLPRLPGASLVAAPHQPCSGWILLRWARNWPRSPATSASSACRCEPAHGLLW